MLLRVWLARTAPYFERSDSDPETLLPPALTPRPRIDQFNPEILEVASVAGGECRPPRGDDAGENCFRPELGEIMARSYARICARW